MYTCSNPKKPRRLNRWFRTMLILGLALVCIQCTGGSGGGSGGSFEVLDFSATLQSPRVYLNDSIEIVFSEDVDPRTVFSGIYIYPSSGAGSRRAFGNYTVKGNRVIFTPPRRWFPARHGVHRVRPPTARRVLRLHSERSGRPEHERPGPERYPDRALYHGEGERLERCIQAGEGAHEARGGPRHRGGRRGS